VSTDEYQHVEDTLVSEEAEDSVIAPAMVVTVYTDGTAQSRMLVRLAALSTKQRYRIFDVSDATSGSSGAGGGGSAIGGTPGTAGTPGTPGSSETSVVRGKGGGQPTASGGTRDTGGLIGGLINGLRVVFRSPGQIAGIACVWMLLALPAYLAARRRLLLELPNLRRVQEDV
jgi:hypothetical protein